jgi:alanine-glyoxylate transaminase/serine-glyoxylate transaminase/serine-pyruvate transaminase
MPSGRHFLQIPGPTNLPERISRAIARPTIDHRGPEFAQMTLDIFARLKQVFATSSPIVIYPSSGTGAWEAALANTLSPGDRVLMFETGHFANLWSKIATQLGLEVELLPGDWRSGVDAQILHDRLTADNKHAIKAVAAVHNETSTGVLSNIAAIRHTLDDSTHPALLLVDTISSLASVDYRHDEWGVDVTVAGSQKGLMLPPGLSFNAISAKALQAAQQATLPHSYWDWGPMLETNAQGFFPYTPATNLLFGLDEALNMLFEEGLEHVFARHHRHAEATRQAVRAWGLELLCRSDREYSPTLTAVLLPAEHDADALRQLILERFDLSLGTGLGRVKGKVFRIGHLGDFNDLTLAGTLCGVEMGLGLADVPHRKGGVAAALNFLATAQNK